MEQPIEIQVDTTKPQKGRVVVGLKGIKLSTPTVLKRVNSALRYMAIGTVALLNSSGWLSAKHTEQAINVCAVFILLTGTVDVLTGVDPNKTYTISKK